jgi:hypothetical protein
MFTTKDTKASADRLSYDGLGAAIEVHRQLGPGVIVEVISVSKLLPIHRAQV